MSSDPSTRKSTRRLAVRLAILAIVLVAAVASGRSAGRWLVREDSLAKADVIVVLSGGLPYRAEEAARIFRMGYAPEVWVSYPVSPSAELQRMGIHYVGEEEYNQQILIREGVPASAVSVFPDIVINTAQEMREVSREVERRGKTRVIFVTSPEHTRRVRTLWKRIAGKSAVAIVRGTQDDPFDSAHWWRTTRDALAVVREYLGLMNAWVGLPVRPQ
jgi:uncharacterized SAM-binding protein YcdF (DUF218 family)